MNKIAIVKLDHTGEEMMRYSADLLERAEDEVIVEARFGLDAHPTGELVIERDDRFVESYFPARWYNIFEIYSGGDDKLKGWYCNITEPAEIGRDLITYRDLALDLVVYPDGRQEILDEDEFAALPLSEEQRRGAQQGMDELQARFRAQFLE